LDERAKLVGIVSDSDLFKFSWVEEDIARSDMGLGEDEDQWTWEGIRSMMRLYYVVSRVSLPLAPVKDVMVTDLVKGVRRSRIKSIANCMVKRNISQAPVQDAEGRLVGMVTDIGLLRFFLK
jgi:CBS domain-containing protein